MVADRLLGLSLEEPPVKRDFPDTHLVRHEHMEIHDALENWARVVRDHARTIDAPPIFKHYRSTDVWVVETKMAPPNTLEGWRMEKAVARLPDKPKAAVRWYYVHPRRDPYAEARRLAVSRQGLADLVHLARTMLKNTT